MKLSVVQLYLQWYLWASVDMGEGNKLWMDSSFKEITYKQNELWLALQI